jgi:PDZ domain-containing protein
MEHTTAPAPPPPTVPPPPGASRRSLAWPAALAALGTLLVIGLLVAAAFVRVPYVVISPGSATPLDGEVLEIEGAPTYPHAGELLYLTVAVSTRDPNLYRYLFARLDPDATVDRRQAVIGCAGFPETARLAREQMDQSQDVAKTVALRRLGYAVPARPSRVLVVGVVCDGPSRGRLELGDVVVAVDGTPVTTADEVRPLIVARAPGETVEFTVERDGRRETVGVRVGARDGQAYAGIVTQTDRRHTFPVDVRIDTARVSGPSAGLAFALAVIDDLTPGDLTGGADVAVTGTIAEDGSVGRVGGVAQKAVVAREAGARLLLVPADEVAEARARAGDVRVVGVRTLDEALDALTRRTGVEVGAMAAPG